MKGLEKDNDDIRENELLSSQIGELWKTSQSFEQDEDRTGAYNFQQLEMFREMWSASALNEIC